MRRAQREEFAEVIKLREIRAYIMANRTQFVQDEVITLSEVLSTFNVVEPTFGATEEPYTVLKETRKFEKERTKLTRRFNDILAERGLMVSKVPGKNKWKVYSLPKASRTVDRLYENSSYKRTTADALSNGMQRHEGRVGRVLNSQLEEIAARRVAHYGGSV